MHAPLNQFRAHLNTFLIIFSSCPLWGKAFWGNIMKHLHWNFLLSHRRKVYSNISHLWPVLSKIVKICHAHTHTVAWTSSLREICREISFLPRRNHFLRNNFLLSNYAIFQIWCCICSDAFTFALIGQIMQKSHFLRSLFSWYIPPSLFFLHSQVARISPFTSPSSLQESCPGPEKCVQV